MFASNHILSGIISAMNIFKSHNTERPVDDISLAEFDEKQKINSERIEIIAQLLPLIVMLAGIIIMSILYKIFM